MSKVTASMIKKYKQVTSARMVLPCTSANSDVIVLPSVIQYWITPMLNGNIPYPFMIKRVTSQCIHNVTNLLRADCSKANRQLRQMYNKAKRRRSRFMIDAACLTDLVPTSAGITNFARTEFLRKVRKSNKKKSYGH